MELKHNLRKAAELGIGLTAIATLILAGCGGGGGSIGSTTASTLGHFLDAAVDGLTYSCTLNGQAVSGVTANGGAFNCTQGSTVTFSIGKIILGSASSVGVITPINLAGPGSDSNSPAVQAIVQLLLSLDPAAASSVAASGVPASIMISPAVLSAANNLAPVTIGANSNQAVIDSWLTTIGTATGITYPSVTTAAASWHLSSTMNGLFQGNYSGSYAGAFSGTWTIAIDANGNVTGTTGGAGGAAQITGTMSTTLGAANTYVFSGLGGVTPWAGTLDLATGVFSGTWDGIATNTYTGTKAAAAGGGGAGGASGSIAIASATPGSHNGAVDVGAANVLNTALNTQAGTPYCDITYAANSSTGNRYEIKVYFRQSDQAVLNVSMFKTDFSWGVGHNDLVNGITGVTVNLGTRQITFNNKVLEGGMSSPNFVATQFATVSGTITFPANATVAACGI